MLAEIKQIYLEQLEAGQTPEPIPDEVTSPINEKDEKIENKMDIFVGNPEENLDDHFEENLEDQLEENIIEESFKNQVKEEHFGAILDNEKNDDKIETETDSSEPSQQELIELDLLINTEE